jgi:hypothetical protein
VIVLLLECLRGAAQRAQVLEHPLGIRPSFGAWRVVAHVLVVGDEPSRPRYHREHDVAQRTYGFAFAADALKARPELDHAIAGRRAWQSLGCAGWGARGDQVAIQFRARARVTNGIAVAGPTSRPGAWIARRNACASHRFTSSVR